MVVRASLIAIAVLGLAACDRTGEGGGVGGEAAASEGMPEQFVGVWAADCSQPFVRFEPEQIHIYPDGQTYPLTAASYDGQALHVSYSSQSGPIEETYAAEGETLRLAGGVYEGSEVTWDKLPMERCE